MAGTDTTPDVSVVMPARNAERYVRAAVASVLGQEGVLVELVLVDDRSSDRTVKEAAGAAAEAGCAERLRVVPGPGRGIAAAFNAGLAACRGRYVARCDADDEFAPGRLAAQAAWLDAHGEFAAVCGGFSTMHPDGGHIADLACRGNAEGEITGELRAGRTDTSFCTFLTRRDVLRRLGGCREYFETAEDIDLQLRLASVGRVWYAPGSTYRYRLHDDSITHRQRSARRDFFEQTARVFAAQRSSGSPDDLEHGRAPVPPPDAGTRGDAAADARGHLLGAAWRSYAGGDRAGAVRMAVSAVRRWPLSAATWRALAVMAGRRARGGAK